MTSDAPILITCVGVEHDLELLSHFLDHYLSLGLDPARMRPILNADASDAPGLDEARRILSAAGVERAEEWIAPYTSEAMWAKRREVQAREARETDWVISADVDEYHAYPEPLPRFLARCEGMGVDCVQGVFIDRLAPGGALAEVRPEPDLMAQFPVEAEVAWSIAGRGAWHDRRGTVKMMAMRGGVMPGRGGHRPYRGQVVRHLYGYPLGDFPGIERPRFRFAVPTRVHHVHWTATLPERLRRRLATPGVSKAGVEYGQKQLDHFARHGGVALDRVALAGPGADGRDWLDRLRRMRREGRLRHGVSAVTGSLRGAVGR